MASKKVISGLLEEYSDVIRKSPYWVKISFKAFVLLPDNVVLNSSFLDFLLGSSIDNYKMSKGMADYGLSQASGQKCANCVRFYQNNVSGKNICTKVRGDVKDSMWCKLWNGKK